MNWDEYENPPKPNPPSYHDDRIRQKAPENEIPTSDLAYLSDVALRNRMRHAGDKNKNRVPATGVDQKTMNPDKPLAKHTDKLRPRLLNDKGEQGKQDYCWRRD